MATAHLPYAYFDGQIVPFADAKVSVATQAFQYGTGAFAGIRGYLSADGETINIFRLRDHCARFMQSAGLLKVALPFDRDGLYDLVVELTERNAPTGDVYYRPFAYKAGLEIGPALDGIADGFTMFMLSLGSLFDSDAGLALMVSTWRRIGDNAIPARGKISGAYANSAFAKDEAHSYGFDDALLLNERGKVSEASAANCFLVRNGILSTPPLTADVLEGITRRSLIELAQEQGIRVEEREIDRTELYVADELFLCGTGAQLTPVTSIDRRPIGTGRPGAITLGLQRRFFDIVRGRAPEYGHWLTEVPVARAVAAD
jgi:branched-chain amino acid aminotransferase